MRPSCSVHPDSRRTGQATSRTHGLNNAKRSIYRLPVFRNYVCSRARADEESWAVCESADFGRSTRLLVQGEWWSGGLELFALELIREDADRALGVATSWPAVERLGPEKWDARKRRFPWLLEFGGHVRVVNPLECLLIYGYEGVLPLFRFLGARTAALAYASNPHPLSKTQSEKRTYLYSLRPEPI